VRTAGLVAVDDEVLRRIGTPFTNTILAKRKLTKVRDNNNERKRKK
jgi:hypothetical protein